MSDPTLRMALFLREHPGWTPDDLERADPDLIEQMRALDLVSARVAQQRQARG